MFDEFEGKMADYSTLKKLYFAIIEAGYRLVDDAFFIDLSNEKDGLFELAVLPMEYDENIDTPNAFGIGICCGEIMECGLEC